MRFVGGRRGQLARRTRRPGTRRTGWSAATSVIGASSSPICARGRSSGVDAEAGPAGDVADREGEPRLEHLVGDLGRVERRLERERRRSGSRWLHAGRSPAFFGRRSVSSASAPTMTRQVELAAEDRRRPRPARAPAAWCRRCPSRGGGAASMPSALGQPAGRVVVRPALAVDDLRGCRRRRARRPVAGQRVVGGRAGHTSSHSSSGSGAGPSPGRIVRWAPPMRHGVRGSMAHRALSSAGRASRRTPSGPPWRPRWRRPCRPARSRSCRPRAGRRPGRAARSPWWPARPAGALAVMRRGPVERPGRPARRRATISLSRPELERPRGRERLGGEQELHRRREGELAGEAHGRAAAGEEARASAPSRRRWRARWRCGCRCRRASPCRRPRTARRRRR